MENFIKVLDAPTKDNFLSYIEELRNIYPDDKSFPESIINTLQWYIEFYDDEDDRISFFSSFWLLLPNYVQKRYHYLIEE